MSARGYLLALALAAAGGLVALLALRQQWAHVITYQPAPLPAGADSVTGEALVPAAWALTLASLAGVVAVVATRRLVRRAVGALLALFGAAIALMVVTGASTPDVLAAARGAAFAQGGSVTGGSSGNLGTLPGGSPGVTSATHIVLVSFPWRGIALLGALALVAAGVLVAWRGGKWPGMSSRYERPAPSGGERADSASLWDSLSRGLDPTEREDASRPSSR